ncbi:MAG TPA: GTP cyclohydrolase I FolE [Cytophagales bacterium]|nr:GTP cyclohydrolase I FolE [Cytophagales bacterium]HAP59856.1 GTP cyclohydrolase I FolE [Cytophagales bacterium]
MKSIDERVEERQQYELNGDAHLMTSVDTPLRKDAFAKPDQEKINNIEKMFAGIMEELGLDLTDNSLKGTPYRVAKMYVKEMFGGLNPENKPKLSVFDNKYQYNKMLVEKDITFSSACEHHFLPIVGKAHIGYISSGKVIGISKLNRVVEYYGRRPQVQERMTLQIFNELKEALQTEDIIVVIEAEHLCVSSRGVNDKTSRTTTLEYGGKYEDDGLRNEFYQLM